MSQHPPRQSFIAQVISALRTLLLTGIAVWLPLIITFWVLHWLVTSIDGLQNHLPEAWRPELMIGQDIPGFGILLVILILLSTGFFARNFIGIKIIALWEELLDRIPFVKSLYRGIKQVSDNIFSDKSTAFRSAVLVEFPRPGAWTIAFVTTNNPPEQEQADAFSNSIGLYVPTTPNPTSGYLIWVNTSEIKPLNMTVEEALKVVISMGVLSKNGTPNTIET